MLKISLFQLTLKHQLQNRNLSLGHPLLFTQCCLLRHDL